MSETAADIEGFVAAIGDIPHLLDPALVRQKSRDMSGAYSPVLKRELRGRDADLVVSPRGREDVFRIAAAAARHGVPLIARGGGTANFGQGIPLRGGAMLDMTALTRVLWQKGPAVRAEPGIRLIDLDAATRPNGWELRIHPSTKRQATLGGFVGGGHAGVGSCRWGILRDRGNILGLQVLSVEAEPKLVELRGAAVNLVHHAYGTNGIMLELEMPLAPAWPWVEAVTFFPDFLQSVRFSEALAMADGIVTKLISLDAWPLPSMMRPLAPLVREGEAMVLCMVAEPCMEAYRELVADHGGVIAGECAEGQGAYGAPLYEFAWGHARFHINKVDRSLVGCVGLYTQPDLVGSIARSVRRFEKLGAFHFEVKRFDSGLSFQGSPLFPYVDDAQLAAVVAGMQEDGAMAANNHTFLVREGGMKPVDEAEIAFKRRMDPHDLLNPGKLATDAGSVAASAGTALKAGGWTYAATSTAA